MNNLFGKLAGSLAMVVALALLGCASSERKAARQIDFTPQIIQQASDLFAADAQLSRSHIVVDGFKGEMQLKGQVSTEAQKAQAEKIVWAVRGVKSVENDLQVEAQSKAK